MVRPSLLVSSLFLPSALAAGLYTKTSPVLQLDARSYESLVAKSNHTSIVEFYAPWCGHCQKLKSAFEKAAKSLTGLAKVAAVNCDEEHNKPFCGSMGVQGFPTLKIVRPNTKKAGGRPSVEDYQGARTAKAIVDAVVDKIPNHVARLKDGEVAAWTEKAGPKAILFSDKGTVSATLKALAIDYLGVIDIAQIREKETKTVEEFGIDKFPTLVLIPGDAEPRKKYDGEMKKDGMLEFLKSAAPPNPDPQTRKAKAATSKTDKVKASSASSSFSKTSASHASSEASEARPTQKSETLEDNSNPTASPNPKVDTQKPVDVPGIVPPIPALLDGLSLQQKCLNSKASTCILLLLPELHPENPYPPEAIASLSEIHAKHEASGRKLFPFYQLPESNSQAQALRKLLHIDEGVEIVAINGKRSWWRRYHGVEFALPSVEAWIDGIRMGEGRKETLPKAVVVDAADLPPEPVRVQGDDLEGLKEKFRGELPEGVQFEFEEIDDLEYERIQQAAQKGTDKESEQPVGEEHDEL